MKLAITICATKSYTYAMVAQARRVQGMLLQCERLRGTSGVVILVGDSCPDMEATERLYREELLPANWEVKYIKGDFHDGYKNYQHSAQLVIARMRSVAFAEARRRDVDACLSLDSDVLPQAHSLDVMLHSLEFDRGYYSVATCPYPSQGGGDFLGGRGIPENPILPDVYPDERLIPAPLRARLDAHDIRLKELGGKPDPDWLKQHDKLREAIERCPLKGDVFFRNSSTGVTPFVEVLKERVRAHYGKQGGLGWSKSEDPHVAAFLAEVETLAKEWKPTGFRRRGWCSSAYPAIGLGAMLPTDWCGFGCTTMNREALALAQFDGYDGSGTEDLYIVFKRWHRAGLRISLLTHCPVDHVIRNGKKKGRYTLLQAHHEDRNAECVGHLRLEHRPWFQQTEGEEPAPKKKAKG